MTVKEYIQLVDRVVGTKGSLKVPAYGMNRLMKESTKMIEDVVKNIDLSNYPTGDQADENYAFRYEFDNLNNYVYNTLAGKVNTISDLNNRINDLEEELLYFYPQDATIEGPTNVGFGKTAVYTGKTNTANVTGSFNVNGSIDFGNITDPTQTSCSITNNYSSTTYNPRVITLTLSKKDGTVLLTATKEIAFTPKDVIISKASNAPVQAVLYSAGLASNENYTLKAEAEVIQNGQINLTGSSTGSIFYNSNIETFNEFKYFTGLTELDAYAFNYCTKLQEITFPSTMTSFKTGCCKRRSTLPLFVHGVTTIKTISSDSFYNYISNSYVSDTAKITFEEVDGHVSCSDDYIKYVTIKKFNLCSNNGGLEASSTTSSFSRDKQYIYLQEFFIKPEVTSLNGQFHCKIGTISGGENVQSVYTKAFGDCDVDNIEESVPFGLFDGPNYVKVNGYAFYSNSSSFENGSPRAVMLGENTFEITDGAFDNDGTTTKTINLTYTGSIEDLTKHFKNTYEYVNISCNKTDVEFLITDTSNINAATYQIQVGVGRRLHPRGPIYIHPITNIDGYITPITQSISSGGSIENSSVFTYKEIVDLYIQHTDGNLYTSEEGTAGGYSNDNANGVAVVRPYSGSFVIAKEDASSSTLAGGGYQKTITNIVTTTNSTTAAKDNAGINNTPKIISQLSGYTDSKSVTGAPAAEACVAYVFPNGSTGYLGAFGEWKAAYDNKTSIVNLMSQIGGAEITTSNLYGTSTQYSYMDSWALDLNGGMYYNSRYNTYYVRAFSAPGSLSINCNRPDVEFQVTYTKFRNGGEKTVILKPGIHNTVVPQLNTTVTISVAPGYEGAEMNVNTQTFTYTGSPITATFVAGVESGVYIQHTNNTLYTTTEGTDGGYSNDVANGVAIIDSSCAFTIAKENASTSTLQGGGYQKTITNIVTTTDSDTAVLDFDGEGNTTKIIEQLAGYTDSSGTIGAPAAEACANYTFPNGSKGYLPSLGEGNVAYNNKTAIVEVLSLIGGTAITTSNYYGTSTQDAYNRSWQLHGGNGMMGSGVKDSAAYVRAFSAL